MRSLRDRIETRIQKEICSVCAEALEDGSCGLPPEFPCPLLERLDEVIRVVAHTHSNAVAPYAERLREVVCTNCHSDASGFCEHRNALECALDMYFPLVVEIIEEEIASRGVAGAARPAEQ